MPMVHLRDLIDHAHRNGYAVGAFEVDGLEVLAGVIQAAEQSRAPAILSLSLAHPPGIGFEVLAAALEQAARSASVPVAVLGTDVDDPDQAAAAIRRGCNGLSVRIRVGAFDQSVARAREIVETARTCDVPVEASAGHFGAPQAGGAADPVPASVEEIRTFAERTGTDFLRVALQSSSDGARGRPRPDYRRLGRIRDAVDRPLCIRADPGYSDDQMRRLVGYGISMVECPPGHYDAALSKARDGLEAGAPGLAALRAGLQSAVAEEAGHCMRVWGSAGRAAEVQMQCAPWDPSVRVIPYHPEPGASADRVEQDLQAGRRRLARLPGVREVLIGPSPERRAGGAHCWLVRCVQPSILAGPDEPAGRLAPEGRVEPALPEPSRASKGSAGVPAPGRRRDQPLSRRRWA